MILTNPLRIRRLDSLAYAARDIDERDDVADALVACADVLYALPEATLVAVNIDAEVIEFVFDGVLDEDLGI